MTLFVALSISFTQQLGGAVTRIMQLHTGTKCLNWIFIFGYFVTRPRETLQVCRHQYILCSPGQVTLLCSLSDDVSIHNYITTPDIVTPQYAGHGLTFESGSLQFYYLAVMISIQSARCAGPHQGNIWPMVGGFAVRRYLASNLQTKVDMNEVTHQREAGLHMALCSPLSAGHGHTLPSSATVFILSHPCFG